MSFIVSDPDRKPDEWGFEVGQIDPDWGWFHDKLLAGGPLWEGGGPPADIVSGRIVEELGSANTWAAGPDGVALRYDDTASSYCFLGLPRLEELTVPFTLILYAKINDNNEFQPLIQTQDWASRSGIYSGALIQFNTASTNTHIITGYGDNTGGGSSARRTQTYNTEALLGQYALYAAEMTGATTGNLWVDGVNKGGPDSTAGSGGAMANSATYNGQLGNVQAGASTDADISMWAVINGTFADRQHEMLADDIFGPFRRASRILPRIPAPAAILARNPALRQPLIRM